MPTLDFPPITGDGQEWTDNEGVIWVVFRGAWARVGGVATVLSVPTGTLLAYSSTVPPSGYLYCNGQAVDRTTYPTLFTIIGETYGVGDGSTTFNLPDMRGRAVAGMDDGAGVIANVSGNALGGKLGAELHAMTVAQMPYHNHTGSSASEGSHLHSASSSSNGIHSHSGSASSSSHNHTGSTNNTGSHNHTLAVRSLAQAGGGNNSWTHSSGSTTTSSNGNHSHSVTINSSSHSHTLSINNSSSHAHTITITSGGSHSHTITVGYKGSGDAYNLLQPTFFAIWMIKS